MPVIRISGDTWKRLQKWAVPLEDTPDDAVKKILDVAEGAVKIPPVLNNSLDLQSKRKRLPRGKSTPQSAFRIPIMEALYGLGGRASNDEVLRIVMEKIKPQLKEPDYQEVPSGRDIRWVNSARWAHFNLVKEGMLKKDSPRGIWELSERGKQEVERNRKSR